MPNHTLTKGTFSCVLLSLSVSLTTSSHAISPVNSIQDGRIIQAGAYYNTPNSHTTFINSHSGDLWLQSGSTVRGLEVNGSGNLTNNGGNIQLYAPKSVVRVDGNIDVSGIINGQGAYLGNGGKVQVNATYLYQNGSITALGNQGGHVNINVNSATFTPLAKIDTSSPTGLGGSIHINASGVVDIQKGALLSTNGVPLPGADSNVIQVVGRVVNNEGILNANGIVTGQDFIPSQGGTIRLIANSGNPNLPPVAKALAYNTFFTPTENSAILTRLQGLAHNYANSIRNTGNITANGGTQFSIFDGNGGNGGTVSLNASRSILNQNTGIISVNGGNGTKGGNGGHIELYSRQCSRLSLNNGQIQAIGGHGGASLSNELGNNAGNGGVIALRNLTNNGTISADGGIGNQFGGGTGGNGGAINALNVTNTLSGVIKVMGGLGAGRDSTKGGDGGRFVGENIVNAGTISATGGKGSGGRGILQGGVGGRIQIANLTNSGLIEANGGTGTAGGNGGYLTFSRVSNSGTITANGGSTFTDQFGFSYRPGDGGTIIGAHVINNGVIQADGGNSPPTFGAGGNGGKITLINFYNAGVTEANGGSGNTVNGALGGIGGSISAINASNVGILEAKGGDGSAVIAARGGAGGRITLDNFTNGSSVGDTALVSVSGGNGAGQLGTSGGQGGQITGTHVINNATIEANGGAFLGGTGSGGQGGKMTFIRIKNTGLLTANGGNTTAIEPGTLIGGDGGTIVGKHVTNTGTVQALGGISATSPSRNGKDGTVIGF